MQANVFGGPVSHSGTGHFGSIVAPQHGRIAASINREAIQFADEVLTGNGTLDQAAEAFAGVFVDDRHDLDRAPIGGGVELEVGRPHPVGCIRYRSSTGGRGAVTLASSPLRNPQPLLTP